MHDCSTSELSALSQRMEATTALDRIQQMHEIYPNKLIVTSSFGIHSAISLQLVNQVYPSIPIIFIDTGCLFKDTYLYAEHLTRNLGLNVHCYCTRITPAHQEALYGKRWEASLENLDEYLNDNKIEPINDQKPAFWISGLRRKQSDTRKNRPVTEGQLGILKLPPTIDWNDEAVSIYIESQQHPYHSLETAGHVSVGDWHRTTKLGTGMRPQDTRSGGLKRECRLHENAKWKGKQP